MVSTWRIAVGVVVMLSGVVATGSAGGQMLEPADHLVVRLYDNARVLPVQRAAAVFRANAVFQQAGVRVSWMDCPARGSGKADRRCRDTPRRGELILRLVNLPASADRARPTSLGYSLISATPRTGTFATVFVNRVHDLADHARVERPLLLGRTMAHEIAHLVLASDEHSASGVLRAEFTVEDLRLNAASDAVFMPHDGERLRDARAHATAPVFAAWR
jgi:hypothetical protein